MANIRVDLEYTIQDGIDLIFNAPCDCSQITGLVVYYPSRDAIVSKVFTFRDAHKNNLGSLNNLFVAGARIKVNLDVTNGHAYIQNADTNAYLENKFAEIIDGGTPIKTITGETVQAFVGTRKRFEEELTEEQRDNCFAIITDDTTKEDILAAIEQASRAYHHVSRIIIHNGTDTRAVFYIEATTPNETAPELAKFFISKQGTPQFLRGYMYDLNTDTRYDIDSYTYFGEESNGAFKCSISYVDTDGATIKSKTIYFWDYNGRTTTTQLY